MHYHSFLPGNEVSGGSTTAQGHSSRWQSQSKHRSDSTVTTKLYSTTNATALFNTAEELKPGMLGYTGGWEWSGQGY